jgi:long-chain fatty acid transport protein
MSVPRVAAACVAAVASLLCARASATASPLELFGFGGRSPAMAGTGVASSDSYEAVYLNPAGLARVIAKRATVGGVYGDFTLRRSGEDPDVDPARGVVFGGQFPLPLGGTMKDRVGFGFGFWIPSETLNRARAPFPGTPSFVLLENRAHVIALQFATGVKVRDDVDVGVGVIALAILAGGIHVSTDAAGRFATTSEQELLTRFAPVAGVTWHARPSIDLGVVFRGTSRSDYDIAVTTDIGDVVPIQLPPIRIAGNAQYDPMTVAVEAAWRARPDLLATAQLQWQHWSAFPLPTLNPVSGTPPQEEPGFHDTVVPRLGVEYTRASGQAVLALRGGAAFVMSPAPEASGRQSFLDNHRLVGTAGIGYSAPRSRLPISIDLWAQAHQLVPRRHAKDAGVFEDDLMVVDTKGHVLVGGLTLGVSL